MEERLLQEEASLCCKKQKHWDACVYSLVVLNILGLVGFIVCMILYLTN